VDSCPTKHDIDVYRLEVEPHEDRQVFEDLERRENDVDHLQLLAFVVVLEVEPMPMLDERRVSAVFSLDSMPMMVEKESEEFVVVLSVV